MTIGNVPPSPRVSNLGRSGPTTRSSIPPVPNVIFAGPGVTHAWPTSDACWSPTSAAIGGAPGSAVAGPTIPLVSTSVGQHPLRDPQRLEGVRRATASRRCGGAT